MLDAEHIPLHELDQLAAGLLAESRRTTAETHLHDCPQCATRLDDIRAAQKAELALHPPAAFAAQVMARRQKKPWFSFRWVAAAVPALAAAAIAGVILTSPVKPRDDAIQFKGGPRLVVKARSAEGKTSSIVKSGAALAPGTHLELSALPGKFEHVAIFAVDAKGSVTTVTNVALAKTQTIPVGLRVDDQPGMDRIFAVFTKDPPQIPRAVAELERAFATDGIENMKPSLDGAHVDDLLIRKP